MTITLDDVVLRWHDDIDEQYFIALSRRCIDSGTTMIGGCSSIGAPCIKALAEATRELSVPMTHTRK